MTMPLTNDSLAVAARNGRGDRFLSHLLNQRLAFDPAVLGNALSDWLARLRQEASDRLSSMSVPTAQDEDWRFTDLADLTQTSFVTRSPQEALVQCLASPNCENRIAATLLPESARSLLVMVNGMRAPQLSASDLPDGIFCGTLSQVAERQDLLPYLQSHLTANTDARDVWATLNSACFHDVAVAIVPPGVTAELPIQLVFAVHAPNTEIVHQPRCLVCVGANSSLTLVETFVGGSETPYFTNAVTEIWLGENARLEHVQVQQEGARAFHIAATAIAQSQGSSYQGTTIAMGAHLFRHNLHARSQGAATSTTLNGLALVDGSRLSDTHSAIAHDFPEARSRQVHKCIVGDRGRAVFNGKIQVAKQAQAIDSAQISRNLLLSDRARVDTKPQLEIFADNVKCAHGATVSQLDAEELFYLMSRGIDPAAAQHLLTYAFAAEVIELIPIASLRRSLNDYVLHQHP